MGRWDVVNTVIVRVEGGAPASLADEGVLAGANAIAVEMAAGGAVGGVVVFIDPGLPRAEAATAERGLPLIWSAGPRGRVAGGPGVAHSDVVLTGVHSRPFSPAHLRVKVEGGGRRIGWIARTRTGGDVWEGEPATSDPSRFRIRVFDGATVVRRFEVEGGEALYAGADVAVDFPGGVGADARIGVAQADGRMGWGSEATVALVA